ncbi:unnamed protein product [Camellia sinensis]
MVSWESKTSGAAKTLIVDDREGFRAFSGVSVEGKERRESLGLTAMAEKLDDDGDGNGDELQQKVMKQPLILSLRNQVMGSLVAGFLVLFLGSIEVGSGKSQAYTMNYITWEDMKVDLQKEGLDLNEEQNRSQVIVVDQNGKGDSVTVQGAVDMVPLLNSQRVKVYIHPGIYREKVFVPNSKPCISFTGDENRTSETIITWNDKASDKDNNGRRLGTSRSTSVTIESNFFCAIGITFENSVVAVPRAYGMQAVALRTVFFTQQLKDLEQLQLIIEIHNMMIQGSLL